METQRANSDSFDERQSLQVIKEMIQVSQKKLKADGVLLIIWGYAMSISYLFNYLNDILFLPNGIHRIFQFVDPVLPLIAFVYTIFYVVKQKKKVTTYIGVSLRYVWIALFISLMLTNLILFNILQEANFTLQHPLFMVIIAFAVVVTGIILRYRLIMVGGIVFGILAYLCSYLALRDQMLLEAIAWFIAFVIPGHLMYFKREK